MTEVKKVKSILYVEDEKAIQEELAEVIETFCETLYTADDGIQALKYFDAYKPDIIITDIRMPIMDGIEMCKKIKEKNQNIPIIFTTAFSDVDYFQDAIELQVEGYLLKPISLELLEKKILNIIDNIELKKELFEKEQMLLQSSKLAAIGEMLSNIAHQWRQPLSAISTTATGMKLLKEMDNLPDEQFYKNCDVINDNTQYLSNTIEDFKNFFSPKNQLKVFNLHEYLNKCIDLVSASFDNNLIKTVKEIDEKINSFGDPNQLLQAIINILNNAKDALKDASTLHEKLVFIFTVKEDKDNHIVITIKDNAGGIPENILPKIFEPYFTTKGSKHGTGLGLYITHTIITKNLKGTIKVENEIFEYEEKSYKGAKFTITLPMIK
ncbi:response regulator [Halarcobacter sp.]|uniref:response regulator n=1 Tax=Halarcobacter sp. TaxID=2321133 RepID=UPI003A931C52